MFNELLSLLSLPLRNQMPLLRFYLYRRKKYFCLELVDTVLQFELISTL
jgi:hypothetical protein